MKPDLLIIDDEEDIRTQMKWALNQDYTVHAAGDRAGALALFAECRPQVVLLDLGLPPRPNDVSEGFRVLGDILARDSRAKVIVITGQSEKEHALSAVGQGAYDFMNKPVDMDELKIVLRRAITLATLEAEYRALQHRVNGGDFEGLLGSSAQMEELFANIRKVATVSAPILLLGESGTGKEMTAMAIHRRSHRRDGPFVAINCHAIPESLLESELFGHEKGAFTGAHAQRIGRIEMASGGTLLLDEIGELSPSLQVKLLRFLQEQRIERVGGRKEIEVDTRIIAATNADLQKAMAEGRFREDLYFRLAVVVLRLPPLREREGDVAILARIFLQRFAQENKKDLTFSNKALRAMESYAWPGNVRELENRVRRSAIMTDGRQITPADLELDEGDGARTGLSLKEARDALERDLVRRALSRSKGNVSRAATLLDVSRPTLYELMDRLGISREEKAG